MQILSFNLFLLGFLSSITSALPIDHDDPPEPPPNLGAPHNGNANKLNVRSGFPPLTERAPTSLLKFFDGCRGVWYTVDDKNGEESTVWMKTHNWDQWWFGNDETVPSKKREAYKKRFEEKLTKVFEEEDFQGPVIYSQMQANIWGPTRSGRVELNREIGIRFDVHGKSNNVWLKILKIFQDEKELPQPEYFDFKTSEYTPLLVFKSKRMIL